MHRLSRPASVVRGKPPGHSESWCVAGSPHRDPAHDPASVYRDDDGRINHESFYVDRRPDRVGGVAILGYRKMRRITEVCWYVDGNVIVILRNTTDERDQTRHDLVARRTEWIEASEPNTCSTASSTVTPRRGPAMSNGMTPVRSSVKNIGLMDIGMKSANRSACSMREACLSRLYNTTGRGLQEMHVRDQLVLAAAAAQSGPRINCVKSQF